MLSLGTVKDFYWGINQFSAIVNLTLTQHSSEKKMIPGNQKDNKHAQVSLHCVYFRYNTHTIAW